MEPSLLFMVTLLIGSGVYSLPTIEDNKLPTDEELMSGQPEVILPLNLPTDEESFNQLNLLFSPQSGFRPSSPTSGTYHFVSSTFPEIDARGFHESVFDGIGDYFPSWPKAAAKRGNEMQDYRSQSITDHLGISRPHYNIWKRSAPVSDYWLEPTLQREKRDIHHGISNMVSANSYNNSHYEQHPLVHIISNQQNTLQKNHSERRGESKHWENSSGRIKRSRMSRNYGLESRLRRARGSMGFHADTFSDGFGDFQTMKRSQSQGNILNKLGAYLQKERELRLQQRINEYNHLITASKRRPEMDSMGFHGDTFGGGFGDGFETMKKRRPEMDSSGFHGDTFGGGFGYFETMKKRRPEMDSSGFHGDTFGGGFGDFETMKKRRPEMDSSGFHGDTFGGGFGDGFETMKKRRPEMDSSGFHGDTFGGGFGDFETMKKRRPEMDSTGFHGDTFGGGFGDFETMKKRRPEMDSMGFHGDTFGGGFGDGFETMKKRRPEMDSTGFHGDTFGGGFGDFETMKKRRPEMDSMGFHGDTFGGGFGDGFETMKKRRPEMDSMGFHGDTFGGGFGDFETMKKRRPDMDSSGFHGDTFSRGFGEFYTMKRKDSLEAAHQNNIDNSNDGQSTRHTQPTSTSR